MGDRPSPLSHEIHPDLVEAWQAGRIDAGDAFFGDAMAKIRWRRDVTAEDGVWNSTPYMLGLYNGLEEALAVMQGREPKMRHKPAEGFTGGSCKACHGSPPPGFSCRTCGAEG